MFKSKRSLVLLISGVVAFVFIFNVGLGTFLSNRQAAFHVKPSPTNSTEVTSQDRFSYLGQTGKDALNILKEKTSVEQDNSGLVVGINGRKAQTSKHEYWAFYVNGKLASVGPAQYQTKNTDRIMWRIEKY